MYLTFKNKGFCTLLKFNIAPNKGRAVKLQECIHSFRWLDRGDYPTTGGVHYRSCKNSGRILSHQSSTSAFQCDVSMVSFQDFLGGAGITRGYIFFCLFWGFKDTKCMNSRFWFDKLRSWWIFARKITREVIAVAHCFSSEFLGGFNKKCFSPKSWIISVGLFSKVCFQNAIFF